MSSGQCSMCSTADAVIANPTKIIPFLGLSGSENPTCQEVFDFAPSISDDATCTLVEEQAGFCGCPESTGPINACGLCPDSDTSTGVPDFVTPFGDTCGELEEYISYLSAEECETDRVKLIMRNSWLCKCPNAETICSMCPDGTVDLDNPDLVIPFFNTPNNRNPTCREVRNFASLQDPEDDEFDCDLVQQQAGFCGCPDFEPLDVCSFCPDGSDPGNMTLITPTTDSCEDLNNYVSFFDQAACDDNVAESVMAMGYYCGCPGAVPNCELCPGDSEVMNPDADSGSSGLTCGELNTIVQTLTTNTCVERDGDITAGRSLCCTSGALSLSISLGLSMASLALTFLL